MRRRRVDGSRPTGQDGASRLAASPATLNAGLLRAGVAQRLQAIIGNRAVGRLLAGASDAGRAAVQRSEGDPAAGIAEAQYGRVASGATIHYTKLAAGCMAITAHFSSGGGVGYHFAMMSDNAAQWQEFRGQVGGASLAKVRIDSDMVGEKEGWWVKYALDVDEWEYGAPDTTGGPRSYASLTGEFAGDPAIYQAGWVFDQEHVAGWFQAAMGIAPDFAVTQSPGPYTL